MRVIKSSFVALGVLLAGVGTIAGIAIGFRLTVDWLLGPHSTELDRELTGLLLVAVLTIVGLIVFLNRLANER